MDDILPSALTGWPSGVTSAKNPNSGDNAWTAPVSPRNAAVKVVMIELLIVTLV